MSQVDYEHFEQRAVQADRLIEQLLQRLSSLENTVAQENLKVCFIDLKKRETET